MNWFDTIKTLGSLALALLLALPVAWQRERATRLMGLRTFPLVAVATCAFTLLGKSFIAPGSDDAMARIIQGIITGIGFIGGGAILKLEDRLVGTATAASIWLTGAMGISVAMGQPAIGIALSVANFLILRFLGHEKAEEGHDERKRTKASGDPHDKP